MFVYTNESKKSIIVHKALTFNNEIAAWASQKRQKSRLKEIKANGKDIIHFIWRRAGRACYVYKGHYNEVNSSLSVVAKQGWIANKAPLQSVL
jgi:hypothetical protein